MCCGALFWSQISRLVYGASDKKRGALSIRNNIIHPKTQVKNGVLDYECSNLLSSFFKKKRTFK